MKKSVPSRTARALDAAKQDAQRRPAGTTQRLWDLEGPKIDHKAAAGDLMDHLMEDHELELTQEQALAAIEYALEGNMEGTVLA